MLPTVPRGLRLRLLAFVLAAPIIWCASDLLATGDPLHSLHQTQSLAVDFARPLGAGTALTSIPQNLALLIGGAVLWCGLLGAAGGIILLHERSRLFAVLLLAGAGMFVMLGILRLALWHGICCYRE